MYLILQEGAIKLHEVSLISMGYHLELNVAIIFYTSMFSFSYFLTK